MSQGTLEAGGPLWGWDWDADDDWEGAVLAVLALAVVAATALALHWFGPQDQQTAGPTTQAAGVGPALHLKAQVSGGREARSPEQGKPGPPTCSHSSPTATIPAQGCEPLGGAVLHPQATLRKGALGPQQSPAKEPAGPGADLPGRDSRAAGLPAPVVIHFTPREVEAQLEAGGGCEGLEQRVRGRSRRRQVDSGSGDRTRRRPKPDPLCMGAVPSVWDAVETSASAGLGTAPRELSQGRAPHLGAGELGGSGQTWPWTPRAVPGGGGAGGSPAASSLEGPPRDHLPSPQQPDKAQTKDLESAHPALGPAPVGTEKPGASRQGRGTQEGQAPEQRDAGGSVSSCAQSLPRGPKARLRPRLLPAASTPSPSPLPRGVSQGSDGGYLQPAPAPGSASAPAALQKTLTSSRSPTPASPPAPTSAPASPPAPASTATLASPLTPAPASPPASTTTPASPLTPASLQAPALPIASTETPASPLTPVPVSAATPASPLPPASSTASTATPASPLTPASPTASTTTPASLLTPAACPAPVPVSGPRPLPQEACVALPKGSQERQVSASWGTLIAMVLRSHPFPRQEKLPGRGSRSAPVRVSASSEDSQLACSTQGPVLTLGPGMATEAGKGGPAGAEGEPQPGSFKTNRASPPCQDAPEEKSSDSQPPAALPKAPSQPGPALGSQPLSQPGTRSLCELAQSCEQETVGQGTLGLSPGQATKEEAVTQKQREARKLLAFLQRPGSWGVAEGVRGPCTLEPARAAALRRRLDLGNCLDVLALAQRRGDASLARETYAVMSNNLLHVLGDAQLYRQLSGADRQRILNLRTGRGRTVLGVLVLPSLYPVSCLSSGAEEPAPAGPTQLHVFSPQENSWWPLTRVPDEAPLRGCGLCTMHNYLFLAGGIRGSGAKAVCSNQVFCYNPLTDIWSQVRPMQQARAQLKLVALDGLLYAIGGECLYSMECYDPRTDAWTPRAPLPAGTFPVAHEAVACRGDIYVTGGHLFYRLLRYSPRKDSWDECPYSASHRRSSDMVALGGFLYRFDLLRGVGAAVMRYNTVTGSWSRAASLPLPDPAPLRCAVLGNTIYCLNHQVTATFTISEGTAQFQAQELQPFPLGSKGTLSPFLLTLPSEDPLQTSL